MNIAWYVLTTQGFELVRPLAAQLGGDIFAPRRLACANSQAFDSLPKLVTRTFNSYEAHVFVCAAGIVLRCLAPCLPDNQRKASKGNKGSDPAVLLCDQRGKHIISLLSGHLGGANSLARKLALLTGGTAVITTATDCEGLPSLDLLAREAGCHIADLDEIAPLNAALLEKQRIWLYDPWHCLAAAPPNCFSRVAQMEDLPPGEAQVLVDWRNHAPLPLRLRLVPPLLQAGLGCRQGTAGQALDMALREALQTVGAHSAALAGLASADLKNSEQGLQACAQAWKLPLRFFAAPALEAVPVPNPGSLAGKALGCGPTSVCEAAALLAAGWPKATLLLPKQKKQGIITVALALPLPPDLPGKTLVPDMPTIQDLQDRPGTGKSSKIPGMQCKPDLAATHSLPDDPNARQVPARPAAACKFDTSGAGQGPAAPATLHLVGLGPGDVKNMSAQALAVLEQVQVVVGYSFYMDMIPPALLLGKECISTGMRGEVERCKAAIDTACSGKTTAVVCSGDAGIYGMAGLVLELLEQRGLDSSVPFELVPGIPAFCAAAALLGAPLMHDFACVSLSDLLTPWDLILRRLEAALKGDFVLVLYNPRSRGRDWQLGAALDLARSLRPGTTPVGLVRQACRQGQSVGIYDLAQLDAAQVDMLSLLIIGNHSTRRVGNRMLTPRGYFS